MTTTTNTNTHTCHHRGELRPRQHGRQAAHPQWCDRQLCDTFDPGTPDEFVQHRAKVLGTGPDSVGGHVEAIVDTTPNNDQSAEAVVVLDVRHGLTVGEAQRLAEALEVAAGMVEQVEHNNDGRAGLLADGGRPAVWVCQWIDLAGVEEALVFVKGSCGDEPLTPEAARVLAGRITTAAQVARLAAAW